MTRPAGRRVRWLGHAAGPDRLATETSGKGPAQQPNGQGFGERPRQDSNLCTRLRRPLLGTALICANAP